MFNCVKVVETRGYVLLGGHDREHGQNYHVTIRELNSGNKSNTLDIKLQRNIKLHLDVSIVYKINVV